MKHLHLLLSAAIGTFLAAGCSTPQSSVGTPGVAQTSSASKAVSSGPTTIEHSDGSTSIMIEGITRTESAAAGAVVGGLLGGAISGEQNARARHNASMERRLKGVSPLAKTALVEVPNANGSTTPVFLHKSGGKWIGPRGETYLKLPGPEQLGPAYAR